MPSIDELFYNELITPLLLFGTLTAVNFLMKSNTSDTHNTEFLSNSSSLFDENPGLGFDDPLTQSHHTDLTFTAHGENVITTNNPGSNFAGEREYPTVAKLNEEGERLAQKIEESALLRHYAEQ
jgi:hypothetical protein